MALHYILDGYNIIHQLAPLADLRVEDSRRALIRMLQTQQPQGSARNEVTVVFDGHFDTGGISASSGIRVMCSFDDSADDVIKRMIDEAGNARALVVVTDDKEIRFYARGAGAGFKSVKDFCGPSASKKSAGSGNPGKPLSHTEQYGITREMTDLWLRKRNKDSDGKE